MAEIGMGGTSQTSPKKRSFVNRLVGAETNFQAKDALQGYLHESVNDPFPTHAQAVPIMDEWLEPFPMTYNFRYEEARRIYQEEISFIRDGERTWDEYAETVYNNMQAVLDEPRPSVEID